jgi:hypothetical protein
MKFFVHRFHSNVTQAARHSAFVALNSNEHGKLFDANTPSPGASAVPDIGRSFGFSMLSAELAGAGRRRRQIPSVRKSIECIDGPEQLPFEKIDLCTFI